MNGEIDLKSGDHSLMVPNPLTDSTFDDHTGLQVHTDDVVLDPYTKGLGVRDRNHMLSRIPYVPLLGTAQTHYEDQTGQVQDRSLPG